MLHTVLDLKRPLFNIDFETTGVDTSTARIVEIGFQKYTADGLVQEYRIVVNPGVPIPPETTAIHHIGDEDVVNQPKFRQLAANLAVGLRDCDFAGKNVRFDLRILSAEMNRAGVDWSYAGAYIIDAERIEQIVEKRTLSHLYKKYTGNDLVDAHQAMADVQATADVLVGQLTKYPLALSKNLQKLHEIQWPGWLDCEGKFAWKGETVIVNFGGPKGYKGRPLRDVPNSYLEWIIRENFPPDAKAIAADALVGKYPVRGSVRLDENDEPVL